MTEFHPHPWQTAMFRAMLREDTALLDGGSRIALLRNDFRMSGAEVEFAGRRQGRRQRALLDALAAIAAGESVLLAGWFYRGITVHV